MGIWSTGYFDRARVETEGFEILIGKRDVYRNRFSIRPFWQYCATLYLDGYFMNGPKFSHDKNSNGLRREAREFGKVMDRFSLTTYKLTNGMRVRHTTGERVECDRLDRQELEIFTQSWLRLVSTSKPPTDVRDGIRN